jgi:biopolymer transport protein ExbD
MARLGRRCRQVEEDTELNMIPIMNMFLVLIPFLLMSVSFFHIRAINTSIPIHADTPAKEQISEKQKIKITVIVELKQDEIRISALSDTPNDLALSALETTLPRQLGNDVSVEQLAGHLKRLKDRYPKSDTMILIPDGEVSYNEIIQAMDCARRHETESLFPNVVLSGSMG